jgi:hypothetical protein
MPWQNYRFIRTQQRLLRPEVAFGVYPPAAPFWARGSGICRNIRGGPDHGESVQRTVGWPMSMTVVRGLGALSPCFHLLENADVGGASESST